ncbi:MAG: hypothetical protein ACP5T6_03585, partial [Candidatus Micrarchaeia archaeon]
MSKLQNEAELWDVGCDKEEAKLIVNYLKENEYDKMDEKLSEIINFAAAIGNKAAQKYFRAISKTRAVKELTSKTVMDFATSVNKKVALNYFLAIAKTGRVDILTSRQAMNFATTIDLIDADEYFNAIAETG